MVSIDTHISSVGKIAGPSPSRKGPSTLWCSRPEGHGGTGGERDVDSRCVRQQTRCHKGDRRTHRGESQGGGTGCPRSTCSGGNEYTPVVHRLGCLRGVSTLTAFRVGRRGRGLGPDHRCQHRGLPGVGAHRVLLGAGKFPGLDHQDRQRSRPPTAGRSGLAPPQACRTPGATMKARWELAPRPPGPADTPATSDCTSGSWPSPTARRNQS